MTTKQTNITLIVGVFILCTAFTFHFFMEYTIKQVEDNAPSIIINYDKPQYITHSVTENGTVSETTENTVKEYSYQQLTVSKSVESVDKSENTPKTETPKEYNGIFEGDIITNGELTY